ncbi:hypothetical protein CERSUDRAFT_119281 [Gelatoporia subvermispora B]|uniref:Uncharacterized protein n=1 Tax=Ceriporiopsis subvermispora (strain B) TaxID=914234 RepID=M2QZI0_CERS8|nr:hypothetical protein CERSUDRAFT_119281 [Gelatoporia subvermispora B]
MALISDPGYLIQSLRLNYLRNVDDPYGPRLISLDPSYHANPYTVASGLADVERWPELAMPISPAPSDDEGGKGSRPTRGSAFPGATGLKYTTTIMGPSRAGAMGLRVSGKRGSISRNSVRISVHSEGEIAKLEEQKEYKKEPGAPASSLPTQSDALVGDNESSRDIASGAPSSAPAKGQATATAAAATPPHFIPKFKGAAEMEERRRLRMLARANRGAPGFRPPTQPVTLNPEISSSDEESPDEDEVMPEDDEDFEIVAEADDSLDIDADEFDPEFAAGRSLGMNSDSDGVSILSATNSAMSTSNSSALGNSLPHGSTRMVSRLSPVREGRHSEEKYSEAIPERPEESAPIESFFEMVTPLPKSSRGGRARATSDEKHKVTEPPAPSVPLTPAEDMFSRRPVPALRSAKSALTALLAETSNESSNPFTELYSAISGRSETENMYVRVFFPHAREPAGKALDLKVRKDATVEEVLGFALYTYWEENWLPKLDEGLQGEDDPKWATRCSAVGWVLRIAEDDGEVDEDFPPPDRTGKISKFNFDAYAVLEATTSQVQQNKVLETKIQRRLSRIVIKKKKSTGLLNTASSNLAPPVDNVLGLSPALGSLGSSLGPSSLGPSSSQGPPIFLRIRIADTADAVHVSTTIPATSGTYMAEVFEAVCQKRKLNNPTDYALILESNGMYIFIPLDRTTKSLQGKRDLTLVKKNMLQMYGIEMTQRPVRTTDPNASILKRNSEVLEQQPYSSVFDFANSYRKYTVYRKMPMLVTRSARTLAIDGGYIHIIPTSNKAKHVFDSGKTSSYDLKSVVACQQSSKNSATFKLIVRSDEKRIKRYDFEAENAKLANEIVQTIKSMKVAIERPGTIKNSRRSRQVT